MMASRKSVVGVAFAHTLGFWFIRSASSGAATRRGGKQFADDAGVPRSAAGQRPVGGFAARNVPGNGCRHNGFLSTSARSRPGARRGRGGASKTALE